MRRPDINRLVILLALCCSSGTSTAAADVKPSGLPVVNVSARHDAHFTRIHDVIEDELGYIWFATSDGLARFDGVEFRVYRHDVNDPHSIAHHNVFAVVQGEKGDIWAATTYGVSKLDAGGESFSHFYLNAETKFSKSSNTITELAFDGDGTMWCVGFGGLYRWGPSGKFDRIRTEGTPLANASIRDLFLDRAGDFWCATSVGLFSVINYAASVPQFRKVHEQDLSCADVVATSGNQLICATRDGLWRLDKPTGAFDRIAMDKPPPDLVFHTVRVDRNDQIWAINSEGHTVRLKSNGSITGHYTHLDISNGARSTGLAEGLTVDRDGVIWIYSSTDVFKHVRGYPNFRRILRHEAKGKTNPVHRVVSSTNGDIWTLTNGQLHYSKGTDSRRVEVGPPGAYAGDWILEDAHNRIWVAVVDHGLYVQNGGGHGFKKARLDEKFDRAYIYKMIQDVSDPDVLWVGTRNGLARIQTASMTIEWFDPAKDIDGIPTSRVAVFDQNASGEIWLYNTYYSSLSYFDQGTGRFLEVRPSGAYQQVLKGDVKDIAVDEHAVWIATLFGLTRYDIADSVFSIHTSKDGLYANGIISLVHLDNTLWLAGNQFVASLDKSTGRFRNYRLPQETLRLRSKSRSSNGQELFFGCEDGVLTFEPAATEMSIKPPRVVITRVLVNDTAVVMTANAPHRNILLTHQQNDVEFHFVGFSSTDPQRNRYRCMLEGYDPTWRDLGNTRLARYTNLNHGDYTFRVTAANGDGVPSDHASVVGLTIRPAFWQTQWFRALVLLSIGMIAYFLFTIRKHQQTLQKEKTIAERASEYKSSFLANVSHEIRTPMNAILGMSELAIETDDTKSKDAYLGTISTASNDLLSIINELLDHSKLESGNFVFESIDFSLEEIMQQLQMTFDNIARRQGLEFQVTCDNPKLYLKGDPKRLKQILVNLLSNAIKYTEKGAVILRADIMQTTAQKVDVKFEVTDTGIGIPEDKLIQVFERFETASEDVNSTSASTGLGLHITRQLVEKQGGTIEVTSEVGKGTKATVFLSFGVGQVAEKPTVSDINRAIPANLKVLVAEDSDVNRLLITKMLEKNTADIDIRIAENGLEAVELFNQEVFDLVLMDVKMPQMNGYQATKAIRSLQDEKRNVPVIGVTASAMPEQIQQCIASGMNEVVSKPLTSAALFQAIARVLNESADD